MNVLMLGGPNAGKSTFLVQLYGRMSHTGGRLKTRATPVDLKPISDGLDRLSAGLPLEHTRSTSSTAVQHLPAVTRDGQELDVFVPDYAGETLDHIVRDHQIPESWRSLIIESDLWLLFVRLEQFPDVPTLFSLPSSDERPAGPAQDRPGPGDGVPRRFDELPSDMKFVELMQMLLHARGARPKGAVAQPQLTVLLSCWDELNVEGSPTPGEVAAARMPLLHDFLQAAWVDAGVSWLGLSSQGKRLSPGQADSDFVDKGPEQHGFVVLPDGTRHVDLTRAIQA